MQEKIITYLLQTGVIFGQQHDTLPRTEMSNKKGFYPYSEFIKKQNKKVLLALSVSILGFLAFVLIASSLPVRDGLLGLFFQKASSLAEVGNSTNIVFVDQNDAPVKETTSPFVNVRLVSPWLATAQSNAGEQEVAGVQDVSDEDVQGISTITLQVSSGSDDVNEEDGKLDLKDKRTWVGNGGSRDASWTGYRFNNVNIPRGATINSASLLVYYPTQQWIRISMDIRGDNTGNSATFSSSSKPSGRPLTAGRLNHSSDVRWQSNSWNDLGELKNVVQEIVNRPDWAPGNSLSILMKGTGGNWGRKFAAAYEGSRQLAPKLEITFTTDTQQTTPPPAGTPQPTATPIPTVTPVPYTVSVELAEDAGFTKNYIKAPYTSHPMVATYTFSNGDSGKKTIFARFTSSTGQTQVFSNWIDLRELTPPTPIPTTPPTGGHHGSNSHSMGLWAPTKWDSCSKELHDSYSVIGPDGKRYPTWHPPVHTFEDGSQCTFGHEHGRNPAGSDLMPFIREHFAHDGDTASSGLPFGHANEQLDAYNAANNISNGMRHEDHVGHKVEWENDLRLTVNKCKNTPASTGCFERVDTEVVCDFLMKIHQGTHSPDAFANNLHELQYFVSCSDGTKVAATKMVAFGNPGEFTDNEKTNVVKVGTANPVNSPSGGGVRFIPTINTVKEYILVPQGEWSLFSNGLYEDWISSNYIRKPGQEDWIMYYDPHFAVFSPSRFYDPSKPNNTGRSVDVCTMTEAGGTERARGGACDQMTNYGKVTGITYDDPRSAFNGVKREFYFNQTGIKNAGGPTAWYTDPFGGNAQTSPFPGSIRQYIASIDNSRDQAFESKAIGADRYYGGNGVHAPN